MHSTSHYSTHSFLSVMSSPVVAWQWIPTMSSASVLTSLLAGEAPTVDSQLFTNSISILYYLGADRI
jgi:hypothetical protein